VVAVWVASHGAQRSPGMRTLLSLLATLSLWFILQIARCASWCVGGQQPRAQSIRQFTRAHWPFAFSEAVIVGWGAAGAVELLPADAFAGGEIAVAGAAIAAAPIAPTDAFWLIVKKHVYLGGEGLIGRETDAWVWLLRCSERRRACQAK